MVIARFFIHLRIVALAEMEDNVLPNSRGIPVTLKSVFSSVEFSRTLTDSADDSSETITTTVEQNEP